LNGVKINWQQAIGVFVGLAGVMVAGNGKAIMELMDGEYVQTTDFKHYITDDIRIISGFTVFFVLMMGFWAYAAVLTKRIKANSYQMNFFMALCSLTTGPLTYPYTNNSSTY
jgi:drug/metabolite transporter (DMT)-like permease